MISPSLTARLAFSIPFSRHLLWGLLLPAVLACGSPAQVGGDEPGPGLGGDPGSGGTGTGGGLDVGDTGGTGGGTDEPPDATCGNGELEPGELCDDGNTEDGDGCSADCREVDPDFFCAEPNEPCVPVATCGNGLIEGDEACDDGNTQGNDGCAADCKSVEDGWACARPNRECLRLPVCGNGTRERGEECDDGQMPPQSGDGCSEECKREEGFFCGEPGQPCIEQICGDGVRTPNEDCDDGQMPPQNGDGCSAVCTLETGWRCNSSGDCAPICGDGVRLGGEECDDGNRLSGDGCSAACRIEPFYSCDDDGCTSTIACGNDTVEPGEICDPPGVDGCNATCTGYDSDAGGGADCGNEIIEFGETCDPPNPGNGCSLLCLAEDGFNCPRPGVCIAEPECGDGILQPQENETCDVGSMSSPGCIGCQVQDDWFCTGLQPSVCVEEVCGDGVLTPSEECDTGTASANGCTQCLVDDGWVCPVANQACIPRCGDRKIVGDEQCDDGNRTNEDGCNASCRVEPGNTCPTAAELEAAGPDDDISCEASECGNNVVEPGEGCDDGNSIAGDGCGPTCQNEPVITPGPNPVVALSCGDGLITGEEDCDDGNLTDGDGCSSECKEEEGFECTDFLEPPSSVQMRVTYRDFKAGNALTGVGHPDFQYGYKEHVAGIAGTPCTTSNQDTCGRLDDDGKMELQVNNRPTTGIESSGSFAAWYRDVGPYDVQVIPDVLTLTQQGGAMSTTYRFADGDFFPLDGRGFGRIGSEVETCGSGNSAGVRCQDTCGNNGSTCAGCGSACRDRNFHFTTELRYFFQYQGGETLSFTGDDDVWVFVNGRLAVDIGGVHSELSGRVVLGDDGSPTGTDSNCSVHAQGSLPDLDGCYDAAEQADNQDSRFGLVKGEVYEIVLFHAERHTSESNFALTMSGFLAPRSFCTPICGDGIVVAGEVCDDGDDPDTGNQDGVSGRCNTECTMLAYCGDGEVQDGEDCDNGENRDLYGGDTGSGACAPGCVTPPTCGDGNIQAAFEVCDNGVANDDASYGPGSCTTNCGFGGYCGDGIHQAGHGELCDLGSENGGYGEGSCGYDCQPGPYCGDNIRNGPEQCDGGPNCDANCFILPYCGDGILHPETESCDYGPFHSEAYGSCTQQCEWGPKCGDDIVQDDFEECDEGELNEDGVYDGCTTACFRGPHCGDGLVQEDEGEKCDNGYNDDVYEHDANSCGDECQRPPHCGDGTVQAGYEVCDHGEDNDDDAYDGCNTSCDWGPYCGDGTIDTAAGEACDDGLANRAYSADGEGCGYDCQPAPYCGDGERNGPEQCDLGTAANTGEYGGCNADCTMAPRCGDGVVQPPEACDDGPTGSMECTSSCKRRIVVK